MADDLRNRGDEDISMEQEHEVRYWTERIGVTKEQLAEAVKEVGNSANKVREYFVRKAR